VKAFLLALVLLVAGCMNPKTSHDVARAGVISLAAAARVTHAVCASTILDAVDHQDELSEAQVTKVMHLGAACENGLKIARVLLENAAMGVDKWQDLNAVKVACTVARITDALSEVEMELRQYGANIPWELGQALAVGKYAGALCKP
jgi:signal transduction protein with GAF and PtsI domain